MEHGVGSELSGGALKFRLSTLGRLCACVVLLLLALAVNAGAQTAHFSGGLLTLGGGFNAPEGVAVDGNGNVFVADEGKQCGERDSVRLRYRQLRQDIGQRF